MVTVKSRCLTVDEVSKVMRLKPSTVRRYVRNKVVFPMEILVPRITDRSTILFKEAALHKWLHNEL